MALTASQIRLLQQRAATSLDPQIFGQCARAPSGYQEVLQPYNPSKAIPSAILLKGVPCDAQGLQCYAFKEYVWDACKARLRVLLAELNGIAIGPAATGTPVGATAIARQQAYLEERKAKIARKAEIIEEIFFACNEALDATNIKNYWLFPAGYWFSAAYPRSIVEAQSPSYKVCPASDRAPINFLDVYNRVKARLDALGTLTAAQKNLFTFSKEMWGSAPTGVPYWITQQCNNLWRAKYRDRYSGIASSFVPRQNPFLSNGKINDLYRDPETRFYGYFDHGFFVKYYDFEVVPMVFLDREAAKADREPRRKRRRTKIKSFFKKAGAALASPLGPFTAFVGTSPEGGTQSKEAARAAADYRARAGVLGPKSIEEYAKLWANEIINTSYKDVLVAGIYNYAFQTEMMIFSGLAEEGAEYVAALEDSLKGTIRNSGDASASVFSSIGGVYGAIIGAVAKVLFLALIPLIDKVGVAVGCIPGFIDVPVIRIPESVIGVESDACASLRGQITPEQYNDVRNVFLPKVQLVTGAPVGSFRFATDEEIFESDAPTGDGTTGKILLLGGGAVAVVGLGYALLRRKS